MLSCSEVARKLASGEAADASFRGRLALRMHLLLCRYCRRYAAQMRAIGDLARRAWGLDEDPDALRRLERRVLEQMPSGPARPDGAPGQDPDPGSRGPAEGP